MLIITEHVSYDCDQDSLPMDGSRPYSLIVDPDFSDGVKAYMDSTSVDMGEYLASPLKADDLYHGYPYREVSFSVTILSREESTIADNGFLFDFDSYPDDTQYPVCLYYIEFYNVSTNKAFDTMDGISLANTPCQNERRDNLIASGVAAGISSQPVVGNSAATLFYSDSVTLAAGKYADDFNVSVGSNSAEYQAATVSVLDKEGIFLPPIRFGI